MKAYPSLLKGAQAVMPVASNVTDLIWARFLVKRNV